jgi:hypothetical protein
MGKPVELTARERRKFEGLVQAYFEFEAFDPHPELTPPLRPDPPPSTPAKGRVHRRLWSRWRRGGDRRDQLDG